MGCGGSKAAGVGPSALAARPEGLKASFLLQFIERNGGRGKFMKSTCAAVVEKMILPQTAHLKSSYCELLRRQGKADSVLGPSAYFISHGAGQPFLDVVDCIISGLEGEPAGSDSYIYLHVFCASQHDLQTAARPKELFATTHPSLIRTIGTVFLAFNPWDNPSPLGRAWVLLELLHCVKSGGRFEIVLPAKELAKMLNDDLAKDSSRFSRLLKSIPSSKGASCERKADLETLLPLLQQLGGGFDALDELVRNSVLGWLERLLKNRIGSPGSRPQGDEVLASKFMLVLGGVYFDLERTDEALAYCESSFEIRKRLLGNGDVSTFAAMQRCATIYDKQNKFDKALPLFSECLEKYTAVVGPDHVTTITARLNLAQLFHHWGRYSEALPLYEETAKTIRKVAAANPHATVPDLGKVNAAIGVVAKLVSAKEGAKRRGSKSGIDPGVLPTQAQAQASSERRGSKGGIEVTPEMLGAMMKRSATNGLELDSKEVRGAAVLARRGSKPGLDG